MDPDRRLATLAAVFAPERAAALLERLGTPGAGEASAHAARLAAAPRPERLQALSRALAADSAVRARAEAAARLERTRVASLIRALASGTAALDAPSPFVLRLCRERLGR